MGKKKDDKIGTQGGIMGRPEIEFDEKLWTTIKGLCQIQCTAVEISDVIGVSEDTISRRILEAYGITFAEFIKKHSAGGKASLRRTQFKLAEKNAALAIWLGKQYLGQREPKQGDGTTTEDLDSICNEATAE